MAVVPGARGDYWESRGALLLWFAALSGPLAWALDQLISYSLVKPICAAGNKNLLTMISLAALLLVIAGAMVGWYCVRQLPDAELDGGRRTDRSYFMALIGIGLNALIAILILTAAVPRFVLSPCE
jgi:hypothetical protein